jgi:hypothetical protein
MRILYVGTLGTWSSSLNRCDALTRLGHDVTRLDTGKLLDARPFRRIEGFLQHRTGIFVPERQVRKAAAKAAQARFDVVWINTGDFASAETLKLLRQTGGKLVLYVNDDPTGGRDKRYFQKLRSTIPLYDLCIVPRVASERDFLALGAKRVARIPFAYDEIKHAPFEHDSISPEFRSEVSFVGTWMKGENRDGFLLALAQRGVPISIWGNHYEKSEYWADVKKYWRGPGLTNRNYVAAVQGSKINIGMLSKQNRDLHTERSVEIPYIGGLLCAERTSEHVEMYRENVEAVFWSSAEECADICFALLKDADRRERIRAAGRRRVLDLGRGNESMCRAALAQLACEPA